MKYLIIGALLLFSSSLVFAQTKLQSCAKRVIAITEDPKNGIRVETGKYLKYIVKNHKLTPHQFQLFKEIEECMIEAGSVSYYVYAESNKSLTGCRLYWNHNSKSKIWRCGKVEGG